MTSESERPDRARTGIVVSCLSCGRVATLPRGDGMAEIPLVQLTRRLRCSECGSRAVRAERPETPQQLARAMRLRMDEGGR